MTPRKFGRVYLRDNQRADRQYQRAQVRRRNPQVDYEGHRAGYQPGCFTCGMAGHYARDCPYAERNPAFNTSLDANEMDRRRNRAYQISIESGNRFDRARYGGGDPEDLLPVQGPLPESEF